MGENLENFSEGVCNSQGQFIFLYEILVFDKEFSTNPRSLEEILKILEGSIQCPRGRGIAGDRRSPASALPREHGMLPKGIFPTGDGDMAVNSRPKARISRVFF